MDFPKPKEKAIPRRVLDVFFTTPNPTSATKSWASYCDIEDGDVISISFNLDFGKRKEMHTAKITRELVNEVYQDMLKVFTDTRVVNKMREAVEEPNPKKIDLEIIDLLLQTAIFGSPNKSVYAPKDA